MIEHSVFKTLELLNEWYAKNEDNIYIISISYELYHYEGNHHVYFKRK